MVDDAETNWEKADHPLKDGVMGTQHPCGQPAVITSPGSASNFGFQFGQFWVRLKYSGNSDPPSQSAGATVHLSGEVILNVDTDAETDYSDAESDLENEDQNCGSTSVSQLITQH